MKIGITDTLSGDNYENYEQWIHSADSDVEIVKLSYDSSVNGNLENLSGLVLSGGGDVDPGLYHKHDDPAKAKGVDTRRDNFEFELLDRALDIDLPILGICRGMQLMNVFLGGSLVTDLVSSRFEDHDAQENKFREHPVSFFPNTLLSALTNAVEGNVNSYHHQSIYRLGRGLMVTAVSRDGVPEASEWSLKEGMPFLLLTQWHPERVPQNLLSEKIARLFLREANIYKKNK
ncbi:MAG: gamma-glutamyl-gamma-aminobutyrate hydrolase family protein [Bacteroidota bacterium]